MLSSFPIDELALRFLTLVGMTLPAIAIVSHIAATKAREEVRAITAFFITLVSLSLLLLAAGFNIAFLVYHSSNRFLFNGSVVLYLASLAAILISVVFLYLAYKPRK